MNDFGFQIANGSSLFLIIRNLKSVIVKVFPLCQFDQRYREYFRDSIIPV
jgi:hypothetical protein